MLNLYVFSVKSLRREESGLLDSACESKISSHGFPLFAENKFSKFLFNQGRQERVPALIYFYLVKFWKRWDICL